MTNILVVDDDQDFTRSQCDWLKTERYEVLAAFSEQEAKEILSKKGENICIALIDVYMEKKDSGITLVKHIRKLYPYIVPIVITGHAKFEDAAACMQEGCFSYIVKGETPSEKILIIIKSAIEHYRFLTALPRLRSGLDAAKKQLKEFHKKMEDLSSTLQRIADEILLHTDNKEG